MRQIWEILTCGKFVTFWLCAHAIVLSIPDFTQNSSFAGQCPIFGSSISFRMNYHTHTSSLVALSSFPLLEAPPSATPPKPSWPLSPEGVEPSVSLGLLDERVGLFWSSSRASASRTSRWSLRDWLFCKANLILNFSNFYIIFMAGINSCNTVATILYCTLHKF